APNRVALNLAGIEVAEVKRGDTLVPPDTLEAVSTIDAEIVMLPEVPALKHRSKVRVHAFTTEALATVLVFESKDSETLDQGELSSAGTMLVRLKLARPMVVLPGDRFVVRQPSPAMTLAGGRVLDAHPQQGLKRAASLAWLQKLRHATGSQQVMLRVQRRGVSGVSVRELVGETGLIPEALQKIMLPMVHEGHLIGTGSRPESIDFVLTADALTTGMELLIKEFSRVKGGTIARAELVSRTRLKEGVFELASARLQRGKRIVLGAQGFSLPVQGLPTTTAQSPRLAEVEALYQAAGLATPILSEIERKLRLAPKELSALITMLLRAKKLVRMGADNLFIHSHALEQLAIRLKAHRGESFDVARFKDFTNLTRKHAIPLLEYLDGARITRNQNGTRVVL
ncbi:MAG: SelB C-terminal domain-containing protein, partial [Janthinobacterium lividum]